MTKRAIVTGATSGIGRALALKLAREGFLVGVIGRRGDRLEELKQLFPENIVSAPFDLRRYMDLPTILAGLARQLGGLDLIVAGAGVDRRNPALILEPELETIEVNVAAFVVTVDWAADYFKQQGRGHIVGVSSVAAFWSNARTLAYNASKSFEAKYLAGLYANLKPKGINVTDVCPGFVATEMTAGRTDMFWVASAEKVANQIYKSIQKKKRIAYVSRRWRYIGWIMRILPFSFYSRFTMQS
ncbi:MAG: SDR family NAD(P)-dependent oxidoreductase [Candidatus Zixiibacteriota bacterium]